MSAPLQAVLRFAVIGMLAIGGPALAGDAPTAQVLQGQGPSAGRGPVVLRVGGDGLAVRDPTDGSVLLYGLDTLEPRGAWASLTPFSDLAVGPAGDRVAVVGWDGLWWARAGDPEAEMISNAALWGGGLASMPVAVAWEADGNGVVVLGRQVLRVDLDGVVQPLPLAEGRSPVALWSGTSGLWVATDDGGVNVWPGDDRPFTVPPGPVDLGRVLALAASPDGTEVARLHRGTASSVLRITRVNGEETGRYEVPSGGSAELDWTATGLVLTIGSRVGWLAPGAHGVSWAGDRAGLRGATRSADGTLVSVDAHGALRVGDRSLPGRATTDFVVADAEGLRFGFQGGWVRVDEDGVEGVAVPGLDGRRAVHTPAGPAVVGQDGGLVVHGPDGGVHVAVDPDEGLVQDVALGPDQGSVMIGGELGMVRWVGLDGVEVGRRPLPKGSAVAVAWSPDELGVAALADDGRLWVITPSNPELVERLAGLRRPRSLAWGSGEAGLAVAAGEAAEVTPGAPRVVVVPGALDVAWSGAGALAWVADDGSLWWDDDPSELDGRRVPGVHGARGLTWFSHGGRELVAWAGTTAGIADPRDGPRLRLLAGEDPVVVTRDCRSSVDGAPVRCLDSGGERTEPVPAEVSGLDLISAE